MARDRRLYVYYRVTQVDLPAAVDAVRQMQARLLAAHPGLQAELLRRPELRDGEVTLMETYAAAGGVDDALQQRIATAAEVLATWLRGARHSERFDSLD